MVITRGSESAIFHVLFKRTEYPRNPGSSPGKLDAKSRKLKVGIHSNNPTLRYLLEHFRMQPSFFFFFFFFFLFRASIHCIVRFVRLQPNEMSYPYCAFAFSLLFCYQTSISIQTATVVVRFAAL